MYNLLRVEVYTFIKWGGLYINQEERFIHLSRGEVYTFIPLDKCKTSPLDKCINLSS
jgi:hypothetical protein